MEDLTEQSLVDTFYTHFVSLVEIRCDLVRIFLQSATLEDDNFHICSKELPQNFINISFPKSTLRSEANIHFFKTEQVAFLMEKISSASEISGLTDFARQTFTKENRFPSL